MWVILFITQVLMKLSLLLHLVLADVHVLFIFIFIGTEVFVETLQKTAMRRLRKFLPSLKVFVVLEH
jgi:hypothetical protein